MSEFCSTFVADLTYIQCMTVSAKAELKGNPVQIRDSPAAVNSCHRFNNMSTRMAFWGVEPLDSFLEREEIFLFYNTFRCLPNYNVL